MEFMEVIPVPQWLSPDPLPLPQWITDVPEQDYIPYEESVIDKLGKPLDITIIDELTPFLEPHRYKIAYGGRGCIHADTLIDTPSGQVRVADFRGGDVYSLSGAGVVIAQALRPVKYPTTPMFQVETEDGHSITVTAEHKFLTKTAWKTCREIAASHDPIYVASPSQTSQDIFRQGSLEGVRHYTRIILNYLYGYWMDYHLCDGQLHQGSDTYQDILPSLADVCAHKTHISSRRGGRASSQIYNHVYWLLSHLSSRDVLHAEGDTGCALKENHTSPRISESFLHLLREYQLSPQRINLDELVQELCGFFQEILDESGIHQAQNLLAVRQLLQYNVGDSSYSDSLVNNVSIHYTTPASITQVEDAEYYDLFVPQYNNYLTNGLVNHNSSKSWGFARMLIARAFSGYEKILCCREIQGSIKESVHALLEDQIRRLSLTKAFEIQTKKITCLTTGSVFLFEGLHHNINKIKSMEGVTIVWAEEAEKISSASWKTLIPTIRRDDSEIWVSFNPDDDLDDTWLRFVEDPPPDCYSVSINYHQNPWFPDVLRAEMEYCKQKDYDEYEHTWLGKPRKAMAGAYYATQMTEAWTKGRVTNVPHDPDATVQVSFDLGMADSMVLWFVQRNGSEVRVIDCWEYTGVTLPNVLKDLINSEYIISQVVLPHDGRVRGMLTGKRRIDVVEAAGFNVTEAPTLHDGVGVDDGIRAVKTFLSRCWFDKTKCEKGLKALKRYRTKYNEERKVFDNKPFHDWTSDFADSFRYMAITRPEIEFNNWGQDIDYNKASVHI